MFSNAKSVEINGKEVKSIILENGAILYEKEYPYVLSVTSDKDILSYADQDSATLTASLTKGGVPVEGEEVKFYVVEDIPAGLSFTGNKFTIDSDSMGLDGSNIVIDWGDGSTTTYTGVSSLNHTYSEAGDYFITITGVISFKYRCFLKCSGLTSVVIPDSVTSLGDSCFDSCLGLTSVVISDSVTSLGSYCFSDCYRLTSIMIPDSVTILGSYCFYDCMNLTSLICNWTTNPPTFNSTWINNVPSSFKFSIPNGTTQVYLDAGYPSDKLVERSE